MCLNKIILRIFPQTTSTCVSLEFSGYYLKISRRYKTDTEWIKKYRSHDRCRSIDAQNDGSETHLMMTVKFNCKILIKCKLFLCQIFYEYGNFYYESISFLRFILVKDGWKGICQMISTIYTQIWMPRKWHEI